MKKTTKVTLLSMLVYPGMGHLLLKKYAIALAFISSFSYLLLSFINDVITKSQQVIDSLVQGEIPLELSAITLALEEHGVLGSQQQTMVSYFLLLIWALAAFDAYRIAKKLNPIKAKD
jgi:hypothetical protein